MVDPVIPVVERSVKTADVDPAILEPRPLPYLVVILNHAIWLFRPFKRRTTKQRGVRHRVGNSWTRASFAHVGG